MRGVGLAAIVLIAADLMIASGSFNPASDPALLDYTPPALAWLQQQPGEWRFTVVQDSSQPPLLNANMTWRYGLEDIRGYESIISAQYVDYLRGLADQRQLDFNRIAPIYTDQLDALRSPRLDALNVRYIVAPLNVALDQPNLVEVYQDEVVRIWENTDALPRAYLEGTTEPVEAVPLTAREWQLTLPDDTSAPVIVSITYAPGWRAYQTGANGEFEVPVELAAGNFIRVLAQGAAGSVRLVYSPASFQVGAFASFISAVIVLLIAGMWLWQRFVARTATDGAG